MLLLKRLFALGSDMLLISFVPFPFWLIINQFIAIDFSQTIEEILIGAMYAGSFYAYSVVLTSWKQSTIGKMLFRIKVDGIEERFISFKSVLIREFIKILQMSIWPVALVVALRSQGSRSLNDYVAGTIVTER